ncbi:MAG TPA: carboxypeptidase-like regulatory domain-containing protein [Acidobacteriaceae bacterium]|nr:carboxypeptidase-like regulatory domain-containing protein [Acidobacteriaceae bacterium]
MTRFFRFICLAVLALLVIPVIAQDTSAAPGPPPGHAPVKPPPPPPRNARITGTVLCADTHRPARGAMVAILPLPPTDAKQQGNTGSEVLTRAGSDGAYIADHLVAGEYSVIAMLPGYLSPMDDFTAEDMSSNSPEKMRGLLIKYGTVVVAAQETGRFDVTLQRGAAVSGQVLYSDGSPASQVTMDVQKVDAKPPTTKSAEDAMNAGALMRILFMHQSQSTDDLGHFRIAGLPPGTYRVAAVQAPMNPLNGGGDEFMGGLMGLAPNAHDMHIYSGDTLHKKAAKTYELRSGDEVTGIDITIPSDDFHRIQGRLSTPDGRGITTATLTLTDTTDDSLIFRGDLSRDGAFVFTGVPAGTYTLAATDAKIGTMPEGFPDNMPVRADMIKATNAFADSNTSVIVKESDVADVNLTLTEVPLSPDVNKPETSPPGNGPAPPPQ